MSSPVSIHVTFMFTLGKKKAQNDMSIPVNGYRLG